MKAAHIFLFTVIIACLVIISIVSFHAVAEIHYLKTFYPDHFSVAEAAYAAVVELIKVTLISFPLVMMILVCLLLVWFCRQAKQ